MFDQNCLPNLIGKDEALESETVEKLEAAALQLTPADRARLVDRLIATVDADPEVEEAWAAEVERRQTGIEDGDLIWLDLSSP